MDENIIMDREQFAFELAKNAAIHARLFDSNEKEAVIKSLQKSGIEVTESILTEVAKLSNPSVAICWTRSEKNAGHRVFDIPFSHYPKIYTKITKSR